MSDFLRTSDFALIATQMKVGYIRRWSSNGFGRSAEFGCPPRVVTIISTDFAAER